MKKTILSLSVLATSMFAGSDFFADDVVGVKAGTLGLGLEYTKKYSDKLYARFGFNGYKYSDSDTKSDIKYDVDLKLQNATAIADYHPYSNGFRMSGGLVLNNNKADFTGEATDGQYNINGIIYNVTDIGSLDGKVDFDSISPYVGMGYSNATKSDGWAFTADVGVMYQGNPNTKLNVTCGNSLDAQGCADLKANVLAEQADLESDIDILEWYPVVSVGIAYRF